MTGVAAGAGVMDGANAGNPEGALAATSAPAGVVVAGVVVIVAVAIDGGVATSWVDTTWPSR